jgi:enamine deaminase RidA (YjgF/YER057c/UK114 family)
MTLSAPRAAETDTAPPSYGHRSQAIVASGYLFSGGQIGAPVERDLPPGEYVTAGTFEEQVASCLQHLDAITVAQDSIRDRVVELSAFVAQADRRALFDEVVAGFMYPPPLIHYQEVTDVALHGLVELDWIVVVDDSIPMAEAIEVIRPLGSTSTGEEVVTSGPFLITNQVFGSGATMTDAARDVFDQIAARLEPFGAGIDSILKMVVYIDDFDRYPEFNAVTQQLLDTEPLPTRSVIVAPAITGSAAVRIDLVAQPR